MIEESDVPERYWALQAGDTQYFISESVANQIQQDWKSWALYDLIYCTDLAGISFCFTKASFRDMYESNPEGWDITWTIHKVISERRKNWRLASGLDPDD